MTGRVLPQLWSSVHQSVAPWDAAGPSVCCDCGEALDDDAHGSPGPGVLGFPNMMWTVPMHDASGIMLRRTVDACSSA